MVFNRFIIQNSILPCNKVVSLFFFIQSWRPFLKWNFFSFVVLYYMCYTERYIRSLDWRKKIDFYFPISTRHCTPFLYEISLVVNYISDGTHFYFTGGYKIAIFLSLFDSVGVVPDYFYTFSSPAFHCRTNLTLKHIQIYYNVCYCVYCPKLRM